MRLTDSRVKVQLSCDKAYQALINQGADFVESLLYQQGQVYGVTTGYGDSCDVAMDKTAVEALSQALFTFHGCGTGAFFVGWARAVGVSGALSVTCQGLFRGALWIIGAAGAVY